MLLSLGLGLCRFIRGTASVPLWTPANYDETDKWWLDPSYGDSLTLTGSNVDSIADRLAESSPLTFTSVSTAEPTLATDGDDFAYFDVAYLDRMSATTPGSFLTSGGFVIWVEDYDNASSDWAAAVPMQWGSSGTGDLFPRNDNENHFNIGWGSTTNRYVNTETFGFDRNTSTKNIWMIVSVAGKLELWKNGVKVWDDTSSNTVGWNSTLNLFSNGSNYRVANFYQMFFAAGEPTAENRQIIEGWIAHKTGAQGQLDGAHPYKSAAPTTSAAASATALRLNGDPLQLNGDYLSLNEAA